jgi:hypothetical protein
MDGMYYLRVAVLYRNARDEAWIVMGGVSLDAVHRTTVQYTLQAIYISIVNPSENETDHHRYQQLSATPATLSRRSSIR